VLQSKEAKIQQSVCTQGAMLVDTWNGTHSSWHM